MEKKFELPFEERYSYEYSKQYYKRHKEGFLKRLSNYFEQKMAAEALSLAGVPEIVLDLPCGAGRFLNTIFNSGTKKVIAADKSAGMLQVIQEYSPFAQSNYLQLLQTNVTQINLPDNSVDSILCMRLLHHIDCKDYRNAIYKEFMRVARQTVCISFWVDGNYKSYREYIHAKKTGNASRCLNSKKLEKELKDIGFAIIGKVDMLKPFLYWRTYVLKV